MQANQNIYESLKNAYRYGGMTIRLILINVIVFLGIQILEVFSRLLLAQDSWLSKFLSAVFTLNTKFSEFIWMPWGIVTSIFAHFTLWHLILNMLFLYFSGRLFEQLFDSKKLWLTYLLGGISGGMLEIVSHAVFPALQNANTVIVGASGSVMAIFMGLAFYRPNLTVSLFGIFPIRLIFLAGFFLISDLISLGLNDGVAHFAHIGGAIFGALAVRNIHSSTNILNKFQQVIVSIQRLMPTVNFNKSKSAKRSNSRIKTDEEYNLEATLKQQKIDSILDKISKSGYESLTRQEKDFLFNQSKK